MELPEELLLVICEHLQPPRYEDEAALLDYDATRRAAHRPAAAVKMVSRGLQSLMTRSARVVKASDYRSWAEFAAQTHRHAELFEGDAPWVRDEVLPSLHEVMPRLRAVDLSIVTRLLAPRTLRGVEALVESTSLVAFHQYHGVMLPICGIVAAAPLTTLSLTIDYMSALHPPDALSPLEGHPTLKHLSLRFEADVAPELPERLPNLETLSIAVGPSTQFNWDSVLPFCPSLKTLTINDQCGDELSHPSIFGALTPRTLNQLMADLPVLERCHVTSVASIVLQTCSIWHRGERVICYRAPPGVSLTFGPEAFPPGVRVVLDVDTAPLPLSVAVWDHETLTDLDATAVPLGYV